MEKPSVFISHSSRDAAWSRMLAQALEKRGLTVWTDDINIMPGELWLEAL